MTVDGEVQLIAPNDARPFSIVGPAQDQGVIGEITRSGGAYEPRVMKVLRRVLKPDSVAFDIGANIGVFAVVMARLCPRGKVYAFEPALETYQYLVRNLSANATGNFVAEQCAAYGSTGNVQFVYSSAYPAGSFVGDQVPAGGEARSVAAVRIDDYVERMGLKRVDLIMIDAEGAELSALTGAEKTLAQHRPVLLAEINPALLQRLGATSYRELAALLQRHHCLYSIGPEGAPARIASDRHLDLLLRKEGVIDLLCLPQGRSGGWRASRRGKGQLAQLEAEFDGNSVPPVCFVAEPSFEIGIPAETPPGGSAQGDASQDVWLTVPVHNTSPSWFSSDALYYPVHVSYRWYDRLGNRLDIQAHRGRFEPPLAPGGSQNVRIPVRFPGTPGHYQLAFTLLQENYAWFDDLDPALQVRVGVTVRPHPPDAGSPPGEAT
ncbi:MAG: hypothetical protein NVSMB32_13000 [Actinomycetota bacterium]